LKARNSLHSPIREKVAPGKAWQGLDQRHSAVRLPTVTAPSASRSPKRARQGTFTKFPTAAGHRAPLKSCVYGWSPRHAFFAEPFVQLVRNRAAKTLGTQYPRKAPSGVGYDAWDMVDLRSAKSREVLSDQNPHLPWNISRFEGIKEFKSGAPPKRLPPVGRAVNRVRQNSLGRSGAGQFLRSQTYYR